MRNATTLLAAALLLLAAPVAAQSDEDPQIRDHERQDRRYIEQLQREAQDRGSEPVDLDDHEAPAAGDPRPVRGREAPGQLGIERLVLIAGQDDREDGADHGDDDGRPDRRCERIDLEPRDQRCRQHQHDRVDHEREQPGGQHGEGQRQQDEDRTDQGVEQPDDERCQQGRERIRHRQAGDQPAHDEQDDGLEDPGQDEPPHAHRPDAFPGKADRRCRGVPDRSEQAHPGSPRMERSSLVPDRSLLSCIGQVSGRCGHEIKVPFEANGSAMAGASAGPLLPSP